MVNGITPNGGFIIRSFSSLRVVSRGGNGSGQHTSRHGLGQTWPVVHFVGLPRGAYRASRARIALGSARARLTFHGLGSAR